MTFKSTWQSICERFDQQAMEKHKAQAHADSTQWVNKRLLKSMNEAEIEPNLLALFKLQLQTLYQLYLVLKELNHNLQTQLQKSAALQVDSQKSAEALKECQRELQVAKREAEERVRRAEEREEEMRAGVDKAI